MFSRERKCIQISVRSFRCRRHSIRDPIQLQKMTEFLFRCHFYCKNTSETHWSGLPSVFLSYGFRFDNNFGDAIIYEIFINPKVLFDVSGHAQYNTYFIFSFSFSDLFARFESMKKIGENIFIKYIEPNSNSNLFVTKIFFAIAFSRLTLFSFLSVSE